jgi:hypothetical protein
LAALGQFRRRCRPPVTVDGTARSQPRSNGPVDWIGCGRAASLLLPLLCADAPPKRFRCLDRPAQGETQPVGCVAESCAPPSARGSETPPAKPEASNCEPLKAVCFGAA